MKSTSYVTSFRMMVFFYLVTTGWIFNISLCEHSINQNQILFTKSQLFVRLWSVTFYLGLSRNKECVFVCKLSTSLKDKSPAPSRPSRTRSVKLRGL